MGWSVLGSVQHGRNRILKTSLHFGRFSRAVCHHPQIHAYILLGFERLRTQHRQHARHAHFFAIFAVGKTRLKNATFKSRRRSSRGTCTLYKRLRVSNHFHNLFLTSNENLTPTSYTFSEFLSANFRENSAIFTKNYTFLLPEKCWKSSFVGHFDPKRCFLPVAFGGSESIQFELAPRDRTPRRRQITRNMQCSKFKMRAAWIDRLHFNLQNLDSS